MTHWHWHMLRALLATSVWSCATAQEAGTIAACLPNAQSSAVEDAYEGYQPTGYKGMLERDPAWFAAVRKVPQPDGRVHYVFKRAPARQRVEFESIATLPLGGKAIGFVAYRQGCGQLLNDHGQSLGVPAFEEIAVEYTGSDSPQSVLLKRRALMPESDVAAFSYLRFTKGRLVASSPHQYLSSYSLSAIPSANTELRATHYEIVSTRPQNGVGLLDLRSLREVLAPRWQGIGQITDFMRRSYNNRQPVANYLLALSLDGLQLHTMDGQPIALPRFDHIRFIHGWYPLDEALRKSGSDPLVIQTQEMDHDAHGSARTGACRLYNEALQPLLDHALPASACLRGSEEAKPVFAYSEEGHTQVYRKRLTQLQHLVLERSAADLTGRLLHILDNGSLLLQTAQQPPYRLLTPEGQEIPERSFDVFENLGCDFLFVRRGEQRWMLNPDGSLSPGMRYPFSC